MAEQEYVTLEEAATSLGIKRFSLNYYLRKLSIQARKFPLNKHAYITRQEVELIRAVRETPWKVEGLDDKKQEEAA